MGALLDGGASPVSLISVLSGQISDLLLVRQMIQAGSGGPDDVAREMGVPRWRADRLCRQARQVRGGQLARWLRSLHRLDVQLKDGRISGADGVRSLGLAMAASFEGRGL
jgi:DNA polymerase III delta subunit